MRSVGVLRKFHASSDNFNVSEEAQSNPTSSTNHFNNRARLRFPRRPADKTPGEGSTSNTVNPQMGSTNTGTTDLSASAQDKLAVSAGSSAGKELLGESLFPT
ncbi:hypothetical protein IFR05_009401 [Cadophora sp. M221]|nr:hypothetical protein IFR05_009401 [Cadophora sp. M221]